MIKADGLCKDYKVVAPKATIRDYLRAIVKPDRRIVSAVKDVSFNIEPGERVGLIGPNGAGKSTIIKMLCGVIEPTSGEIEVLSMCPMVDRKLICGNIGVVFGQRSQLWWDIPVYETFDLLRAMYNIPRNVYMQNRNRIIELLELKSFLDKPVRQLSLGQRMRAEFACSVLHNPRILLLDEPTIGLDVVAKSSIRKFIKNYSAETGATVIITSHDMNDIERLCDRIISLKQGEKCFDGTLETFKASYIENKMIEIVFSATLSSARLVSWDGVASQDIDGHTLKITYNPEIVNLIDILHYASSLGTIVDLNTVGATVERAAKSLYGRSFRERLQ